MKTDAVIAAVLLLFVTAAADGGGGGGVEKCFAGDPDVCAVGW